MALFKKLKNNVGVEEESTQQEMEKQKQKGEEKKSESKQKASDWPQSKGQLAADVYETETEFCVQAPIAGINQEDIEIFVENDMLVIKGERKEPESAKQKKYFYQECYWGPFSRQIILPEDVNPQRVKASFKKAVLLISMPKKQTERKKITIEIEE